MIARSVTVDVAIETAFRAFTEHIGRWWPPDHVPGGGTLVGVRFTDGAVGADLVMETREAGAFPIGRVTRWVPPQALSYDFFIGSSPQAPSVVDVTFTPTPTGTRVDVTHRQGAVASDVWAASSRGYARAWDELVPAFAAFTSHPRENA